MLTFANPQYRRPNQDIEGAQLAERSRQQLRQTVQQVFVETHPFLLLRHVTGRGLPEAGSLCNTRIEGKPF